MQLPVSLQMRLTAVPVLMGEMDDVAYGFMDLGREGQAPGDEPLPCSPPPPACSLHHTEVSIYFLCFNLCWTEVRETPSQMLGPK